MRPWGALLVEGWTQVVYHGARESNALAIRAEYSNRTSLYHHTTPYLLTHRTGDATLSPNKVFCENRRRLKTWRSRSWF